MSIRFRDSQNKFAELSLPQGGGIVGYAADNFLVIDAVGVSGKHMRLTGSGEKLFVEDLQSLNGTFVNQREIAGKTQLFDGDLVQIGLLQLRFIRDGENWEMRAETPVDTTFAFDEFFANDAEDSEEEAGTAVTIIASPEVKEAIRSGDSSVLQALPGGSSASPSAGTELQNLSELGQYKIVRKIGKGGMGVVFLARHKIFNSYRALKVLSHSVKEENSDFYERFMREARIALDIRHPNIVSVMDAEVEEEQDIAYIVMEFVDGGTLRRILKSGKKLSEIQALLIIKNIAAALKSIGEHKIVHRDIKPDNIMFTRQGKVKLADLGIAKNDNEDVNITRNDMMIGTPAYLSPEQIENPQEVDIRSDLYSLGVTLYEMLTGAVPYSGKNTYDIVHRVFSEPIPDPRLKDPAISAASARIVMKMLQKKPGRRYQSPQTLLNDLERVLPALSEESECDVIKSAVWGTELPEGVNGKLAQNISSRLSFLVFSCYQELKELFFQKSPKQRPEHSPLCEEEILFSFRKGTGGKSISGVSLKFDSGAGRKFKLTSSAGYSACLKSDEEGCISINNIPDGEYILTAAAEAQSETHS